MRDRDSGRGFGRLGPVDKSKKDTVVPFDADRVNQAIERAALRTEQERAERARANQDKTFPREPTIEEIEPTALEILDKTENCDQELAIQIQSRLMQMHDDIKEFIFQIAHMDDAFVTECAEF